MVLVVGMGPSLPTQSVLAAGATVIQGRIAGARYEIQIPAHWNRTLLLWSHGDQGQGQPHLSQPGDADQTPAWLLDHGYALAYSSFSHGGWSIAAALHDQIALLDLFTHRVGRPRYTIAWGSSNGALISAGLVQQYPARFAGALAESGVFDATGIWNAALDVGFVFKTLLAPHASLKLVHIANPATNLAIVQRVLAQTQGSARGRARLALAAAMIDEPDWSDSSGPYPRQTPWSTRVTSLIAWLRSNALLFTFSRRSELEQSAGGNPSWNTGVDYAAELEHSVDRDDVRAMYRQGRLSLAGDLRILARTPRIAADPGAVTYLAHNITLTGRLRVPVLTVHTTGDGTAPVEQEQDFADRVHKAGDMSLLRQLFVQRAGHGTFTAPEEITALQVLIHRVETGKWSSVDPGVLNAQARILRRERLLAVPPASAFVAYHFPGYARPFRNQ
jgi:hypothetical protein